MRKKRKTYSSEFKAKVAIESIKSQKTLSELSQIYEVHSNQILKWKQELLANASEIFEKHQRNPEPEVDTSKLYEAIGQLQIENNWLKKKL